MTRLTRALLASALILATLPALGATTAGAQEEQRVATGFLFVKTIDQVVCQTAYSGGFIASHFRRGDCVRADFTVTNTEDGDPVTVELVGPDGEVFLEPTPFFRSEDGWRVVERTDAAWAAGRIEMRVYYDGKLLGASSFFHNALTGSVSPTPKPDDTPYEPGEDVEVSGTIQKIYDLGLSSQREGAAAEFSLQVRAPNGTVWGPYGPFTAAGDGSFTATIPGEATEGLASGPRERFRQLAAIDVIEASYDDPTTGLWYAAEAGSGQLTVVTPATTLLVEAKYASSTGWVKPGATFPLRLIVTNLTGAAQTGAVVTAAAPAGSRFLEVRPLQGAGTASLGSDGSVNWDLGDVAAGDPATPTAHTLLVLAQAVSLDEDPRLVWKDLSVTAALTHDPDVSLSARTHGPKVVPPGEAWDTSRYGDKPFPMVPVDYTDRKHEAGHDGDALDFVVNSPDNPASTFSLYQEMSYGQLYPEGVVPSKGVATADFGSYEPGFDFTNRPLNKPNCRGTTMSDAEFLWETPAYPERVRDGWYQLPGDTEYYGGDDPAFTLGVGSSIDSACGPIGKAVFDAATIADPDIDYNRFDSDKDGVVDFFMMVFVGTGGNGASQLSVPPYDNIWPHSTSLEFYFEDPETGLSGYISDDQLTDHTGQPQCWTDESRSTFATCAADGGDGVDDLPVFVRVGPYNVNPEDAIEAASVISHEYGHHLGLPDFYSSWEAYNDWNLMAADYSQHMTVFSKQDMGWVVPEFLAPGDRRTVEDWSEIKNDTGRIEWRTPDGEPYVLSAANGDQNIHNGQVYGLKLPGRLVVDPVKVAEQASPPHVYYSGSGNDFNCTPAQGHNLDVRLPEIADAADGTQITLRYKSSWDIEWDWDFGFTMVTTDGKSYTALPSEQGYTSTNDRNPHNVSCFATHDNGLTGQSGAYESGPHAVEAARAPESPTAYSNGSPFLTDEYDLSAYAGQDNVVLRWSYFTDAGFVRPGWLIDDVELLIDGEVVYSTDLSDLDEARWFPGGCGDEGMRTAATCTIGWAHLESDAGSTADHAYYVELRDRSGFDFNGRGQSDRGDIGWLPGVLIEYTDEASGYGNNGYPMPPNQHYLDSQPTPGVDCDGNDPSSPPTFGLTGSPICQDAAFTAAAEDSHFDDDPDDEGGPWVDNFVDPSSESGLWEFGYDCLTLDVTAMSGDTGNSAALPSDLTADAVIVAGSGCATVEYSGQPTTGAAPTAVVQAKPNPSGVGETITFDGSLSSDDSTAPDELRYEWDFRSDGTYDAEGQTVHHAYSEAGTYKVTLRVTDSEGNVDVGFLEVTVSGAPGGGDSGLPATGGGLALLGLLALAGAGATRLRRG